MWGFNLQKGVGSYPVIFSIIKGLKLLQISILIRGLQNMFNISKLFISREKNKETMNEQLNCVADDMARMVIHYMLTYREV